MRPWTTMVDVANTARDIAGTVANGSRAIAADPLVVVNWAHAGWTDFKNRTSTAEGMGEFLGDIAWGIASGKAGSNLFGRIPNAPRNVPNVSDGWRALKNRSGNLDDMANSARNQPYYDPRSTIPDRKPPVQPPRIAGEEKALHDLLDDIALRVKKPMTVADANAALDLAREAGIPTRATPGGRDRRPFPSNGSAAAACSHR